MRIPLRQLRKQLKKLLRLLGPQANHLPTTIDIVLVTEAESGAVHARFLNDPTPTDVITFSHGELIICPEVARKQCQEFDLSVEDEVLLYSIHGILHLLGEEDKTRHGYLRMSRRQNTLWQQVRR